MVGKQKRRWSDLSRTQRRLIIAGGAVESVITTMALRDLVRRPAAQVRGPRAAWALGCLVQPVGPVAYLLLGRR
ncbi:MAG: PLD nuclease N-terminal domain-containing protein [Marmoricola sp.]